MCGRKVNPDNKPRKNIRLALPFGSISWIVYFDWLVALVALCAGVCVCVTVFMFSLLLIHQAYDLDEFFRPSDDFDFGHKVCYLPWKPLRRSISIVTPCIMI